MDNYVLRLRPEAARKVTDAVRIRFNSTVRYNGKNQSWDTVIKLKTQQLANHILREATNLSFDEPAPALYRYDSAAIRNKIRCLTAADARKIGIRRNTLFYLKKHAKTSAPFKMRSKVFKKLEASPP
jgi:hypothetical protein